MTRFLALSFALLLSAQAWAGGIAVIDFQRAVNETTEGKAAQTKLDTMFAARRSEIEKKQQALEQEIKDFESRAMILSDAARQEAGETLMQKRGEFQQLYMQYEAEMQQTYMTMLQELDTKMRAVSEKVAREKGYDIVIDRAAVVYMGGSTVDMTDELVKRYNAGN